MLWYPKNCTGGKSVFRLFDYKGLGYMSNCWLLFINVCSSCSSLCSLCISLLVMHFLGFAAFAYFHMFSYFRVWGVWDRYEIQDRVGTVEVIAE